ncbi:pupal cuticle protein 36-like [Penaeus chinensis]|uniref:pupal cuticle protein 36-like n=1 Tax=Penaeus chinensis TaxID=139456 RepID=UPI001FB5A4A8|nr:pupal cuticle protein 36-like [Penaeus chinensis]
MKILITVILLISGNYAVPDGYGASRPAGGLSVGGRISSGVALTKGRRFSGGGGFSGGGRVSSREELSSGGRRVSFGIALSRGGGRVSSGVGFSNGGGFSSGSGFSGGGLSIRGGFPSGEGFSRERGSGGCTAGTVLHVNGSCVTPEVTRRIYVYDAPPQLIQRSGTPPRIPSPRVEHNIVFVRVPEKGAGPEPIVIPPPQQEIIIYVLNKNEGDGGQRVIEVPTPPPSRPEVFFVNYADRENPQLPIGVDLQTALQAAVNGGQVVGGAAGASTSGGGRFRGAPALGGDVFGGSGGFGGAGGGFGGSLEEGFGSGVGQVDVFGGRHIPAPAITYGIP